MYNREIIVGFNTRPTEIIWEEVKPLQLDLEKLLRDAWVRGHMSGSPDSRSIQKYIRNGEDLPERLKPGYMIFSLPVGARKSLSNLTADKIPVIKTLIGVNSLYV